MPSSFVEPRTVRLIISPSSVLFFIALSGSTRMASSSIPSGQYSTTVVASICLHNSRSSDTMICMIGFGQTGAAVRELSRSKRHFLTQTLVPFSLNYPSNDSHTWICPREKLYYDSNQWHTLHRHARVHVNTGHSVVQADKITKSTKVNTW